MNGRERKKMVHSRGWQEKCLIPSFTYTPIDDDLNQFNRSWKPEDFTQEINDKMTSCVSLFHSTLSSSLTFAFNQSPIDANQKRFLSHKSEWTEAYERVCISIDFVIAVSPTPMHSVAKPNGSISICFVVYNTTIYSCWYSCADIWLKMSWIENFIRLTSQFRYSPFLCAVCGLCWHFAIR